MNKTNCPNCGAALPQFGGKCEFCGTRIIDLTMIDFDSGEPCTFALRLPKRLGGGVIYTLALPKLEDITLDTTYREINCGWGFESVAKVRDNYEVAIGMTLQPCLPPDSDVLMTYVKD